MMWKIIMFENVIKVCIDPSLMNKPSLNGCGVKLFALHNLKTSWTFVAHYVGYHLAEHGINLMSVTMCANDF